MNEEQITDALVKRLLDRDKQEKVKKPQSQKTEETTLPVEITQKKTENDTKHKSDIIPQQETEIENLRSELIEIKHILRSLATHLGCRNI
ncbi:MAG: hypothetical protein WC284_09635 [Candidimonas sp.]